MQLELFHGPVSTTEAVLYAQVDRPSEPGEWKLQGTLLGPSNRLANTLPAKLQMDDAGAGETVLARVRVADPCGWSMDLPALYQVDLQLTQDDKVVRSWNAITGFRDFGAASRSFSLNGERWVVRGAFLADGAPIVAEKWRDERMVCVCKDPTEDDLRIASEEGVYLIVQVTGASPEDWAKELRRVATWPAVLAVILPAAPLQPLDPGTKANVVIGCFAEEPTRTATNLGVDFVCVDAERVASFATEAFELPVVAVGREFKGRAGCDQMQSRLAPGNFAGYVVSQS